MSRARLLAGLLLAATAAATVAGGCSTFRFAYGNADWLAARAVAPYLCPTRSQEEALRAVVRDVLDWHRRVELPRYAGSFRAAAERVAARPLTEGDVRALFAWVDAARARASNRLAAPFADFAATLGPRQVRCLATGMANLRDEQLEELEGEPAAVTDRRVDDLAAWLVPWIGPLEDGQRELLASLLPPRADLRAVTRARHDRTRRLLAVLGTAGPTKKRAALRAFVTDGDALLDDAEEALMARWERRNRAASATFLQRLSDTQRAHLANVLRRYAGDFATLAGSD